jgi:hypothetical protein
MSCADFGGYLVKFVGGEEVIDESLKSKLYVISDTQSSKVESICWGGGLKLLYANVIEC